LTTAVANSEDFQLKRFLVYSLIFHAALVVFSVVAGYIQLHRGNAWGGVGGELGRSTNVSLVSHAAIPLPKESVVVPESKTVDPTKGLYKEEPKKPPEPKTDATKIPKFKEEKPLPPTHRSKIDPIKTPPPDNAVPYGKGGNPDLPTGSAPTHGDESSGVSILGQGGADFATRYGWYIEAAKSRIYGNWQQWTIDAAGRNSRTIHCAITFTINRDGSLRDVHISESSGNSTYDNSAYRAVLSSTPLGKLPPEYSGSYVTATLDFNPPGIR
jgi:TonB family protein